MFWKKKHYTSPNFNDRDGDVSPSMLILHYTDMKTPKAALERLCDPAAQVSAHYVVEEGGKIHALVDEDKRAWHAGKSYWNGLTDINSYSIGVEICNCGHSNDYPDFPEKQITVVIMLCKEIIARHNIPAANVLAHSDIAPERKVDPGEKFPWERLAREGVGLWPAPQEMDYQAAQDLILNLDGFDELLCGFGYDLTVERETLFSAFHRRYYPEKFNTGENADEPDIKSIAKLLSLIRKKHES